MEKKYCDVPGSPCLSKKGESNVRFVPFEIFIQVVIYTQRKKGTKTVPLGYYCYKWYPFFKGALFFSLIIMFMEKKYPFGTGALPLRVPYYGQSNSAPRSTILVPFFLSVVVLATTRPVLL